MLPAVRWSNEHGGSLSDADCGCSIPNPPVEPHVCCFPLILEMVTVGGVTTITLSRPIRLVVGQQVAVPFMATTAYMGTFTITHVISATKIQVSGIGGDIAPEFPDDLFVSPFDSSTLHAPQAKMLWPDEMLLFFDVVSGSPPSGMTSPVHLRLNLNDLVTTLSAIGNLDSFWNNGWNVAYTSVVPYSFLDNEAPPADGSTTYYPNGLFTYTDAGTGLQYGLELAWVPCVPGEALLSADLRVYCYGLYPNSYGAAFPIIDEALNHIMDSCYPCIRFNAPEGAIIYPPDGPPTGGTHHGLILGNPGPCYVFTTESGAEIICDPTLPGSFADLPPGYPPPAFGLNEIARITCLVTNCPETPPISLSSPGPEFGFEATSVGDPATCAPLVCAAIATTLGAGSGLVLERSSICDSLACSNIADLLHGVHAPAPLAALRGAALPAPRLSAPLEICKHLGEQTGDFVACPSCGVSKDGAVRTRRKEFKCAVYGTCVIGPWSEDQPGCQGCPFFNKDVSGSEHEAILHSAQRVGAGRHSVHYLGRPGPQAGLRGRLPGSNQRSLPLSVVQQPPHRANRAARPEPRED